jgi:hypothetical protein
MLVVGILVGIGISGRGFVSDAERTRLNADITSLREQRDAASTQVEDLENRQKAAEDFVEGAYPVLAEQRLAGKRVAILVLGPVDPSLGELEQAIEQDAGGNVARIRALTLPLRLEQVEAILDRRRELAGYAGDEQLGNLGRDLGHELATGGETPLWDSLESELVEVKEGNLKDPVDGIVVMRTAEPQQGETSRFLSGIYQGLGGAGVPVVGVEPQRVEQAAIPVFQRHELSTVDGVDTELGKLGMILLLAGGDRGDYGTRDTAEDGILPPIEPLPPNGG